MGAIGLGGPDGADATHMNAMIYGYEKTIVGTGKVMINKLPVLCGIGTVENWKGKIVQLKVMTPDQIYDEEKKLLEEAKQMSMKLPFDNLNVLIVGEIGKDIIGSGMDGSVIGRTRIIRQKEPDTPKIDRIAVLNLTAGSHFNAIGIGLADLTTRWVFNKTDFEATSKNCIISMCPEQGVMPCVMPSDRDAIFVAVRTAGVKESANARLVYIQNTKQIEIMAVSASLLSEIKGNRHLEFIKEETESIMFSESGDLLNFQCEI